MTPGPRPRFRTLPRRQRAVVVLLYLFSITLALLVHSPAGLLLAAAAILLILQGAH